MSLGLLESRIQARRRRRWGIVKWSVVLGILVVAGVYSYETGSVLARYEVTRLNDEIARLEATGARLRNELAELNGALEASKLREEEWSRRYDTDVPKGRPKELFQLVEQQLGAGVDPDRLAFVVGKVQNERACDETPVTKRFYARTPIYEGANDSVRFADGTITVTARGESRTDANGNPQAWYDPAKPVTVTFTQLGGQSSRAEGMLPLHHSVVTDEQEYRFTVVAAENGFINVTGDRCRFP